MKFAHVFYLEIKVTRSYLYNKMDFKLYNDLIDKRLNN